MMSSTTPQVIFLPVKDNQAKLTRICEIVNQHYEQGLRLLITVPSQEAAQFIDTLLWKYPADSFIPHLISEKPVVDAVVITMEQQNLNNAQVLLNLCPGISPIYKQFERIYELFDETHPKKAEQSHQKQVEYASLKKL